MISKLRDFTLEKLYLKIRSIVIRYFHRIEFWFDRRIRNKKIILEAGDFPNFMSRTRFEGLGTIKFSARVTLGQIEMKSGEIYLEAREPVAMICIGSDAAVMNGCEVVARTEIRIGSKVLIGPNTRIYDSDFHEIDPERRHLPGASAPVTICDKVWIGSGSTILKGVTIGAGSIVAAGSIVSKSVPPQVVVGGNPAKFIRNI
jgi:acetyltransferase-like isoleucine patch superfamily enzyme